MENNISKDANSGNDDNCAATAGAPKDTSTRRNVFPPSNTWHLTHVSAARDDMWAYLSYNLIVLVKPRSNYSNDDEIADSESACEKNWPDFTVIGVSNTKYCSVSFCQNDWGNLPVENSPLVSGCEEGFVRIWDLEGTICRMYHNNHKGFPVKGLDWSVRNPSIIFSIDDRGTMTSWNVAKNSLLCLKFNQRATCLKASPHADFVVAFGTVSGVIFVVEATENAKVLFKVNHGDEIQTLIWSPRKGTWGALSPLVHDTPLLVSSSNTVNIPNLIIWSGDGEEIGTLSSWDRDTKLGTGGGRQRLNCSNAMWAKEPGTENLLLVSNGRHGEIVSWSTGSVHDVLHTSHRDDYVYGMVQCGHVIWSLSFEPVIIGWNLVKEDIECIIPTFRGVNALMSSPQLPSLVVMGGVDMYLRSFWMDKDYPECSYLRRPNITFRMRGKITCVAFHPFKDHIVGFGTNDGFLGTYEIKDGNRFFTFFNKQINGCVYTVDWGPGVYLEDDMRYVMNSSADGEEKDTRLMLYACGAQSVYMVNPTAKLCSLINVLKVIEKTNPGSDKLGEYIDMMEMSDKVTDIRWSPDFSYAAVGYKDGRIELYRPPHLKLKCWIKCHNRAIQYLAWRPFDFIAEQPKDHTERLLATASNDGSVRIINLEYLFEENILNDVSSNQEVIQIIKSDKTLKGHGGFFVISIAWSPHNPNHLVSVSYDNTAVVWDISKQEGISRYTGHKHRLVACMFHPKDPYKLFTSSDEYVMDFSLHVWDMRDYPYTPKCGKPFKRTVAAPVKPYLQELNKEVEVNTETASITINPGVSKPLLSSFLLAKMRNKLRHGDSYGGILAVTSEFPNSYSHLKEELAYIIDSETEFSLSRNETKVKCEELLSMKGDDFGNEGFAENIPGAQAFLVGNIGDKNTTDRLLSVEQEMLTEDGNWYAAFRIAHWTRETGWLNDQVRKEHLVIAPVFE